MLRVAWTWIRRYPKPAAALAVAAVLAAIWWSDRPAPTPPSPGRERATEPRLLTPEVELRGIVRQLQEETAGLRKGLEEAVQQLKELRSAGRAGSPTGPPRSFEAFRDELGPPPVPSPPRAASPPAKPEPAPVPAPTSRAPSPPEVPRITVFSIAPVTGPAAPPAPPPRWLHVPAGSVVPMTVLSGVYAPIRATQPLPVLLHLDSASFSPNGTRVPLRRCMAVARALGEYTSRRATLQLDTLSCVLPDGRAVSRPLSGWVSGPDGVFGLGGELVERTGPFLARVALAGVLQGAAAAFAQAQTLTTTTPIGGTQTQITGNTALYGAYSGLAQSASRLAGFYERHLESLVPAIFVPAGIQGAAVIQAGVTFDGVPVETAGWSGDPPWRTLD
jgi:conjugal transfer pilus assembly protein TraB